MRLIQHIGGVGLATAAAMGLLVAASSPALAAVTVTIDGLADPTATSQPNASGTGVEIHSATFDLAVQGLAADGTALALDPDLTLRVIAGNQIVLSGSGLLPDDSVTASLLGTGGNPVISLGGITVGSDGTFTGSLLVPSAVAPGPYTLQIGGVTVGGGLVSAQVGSNVVSTTNRSMVITGERRVAHPNRVFVRGRAQNMNDEVVTARVKLRGQSHYRTGSSRVVRDGRFTWTRVSGKKVYVYFKADGGIRSNRVVIAHR